MSQRSIPYSIIVFDGDCVLCRAAVGFIVKRAKVNKFRFSTRQQLCKNVYEGKKCTGLPETLLLIENDKVYVRSTAVLRIARVLRFPWFLLYLFVVFPRFVRDAGYDFISRNRKLWVKGASNCKVAGPVWHSHVHRGMAVGDSRGQFEDSGR